MAGMSDVPDQRPLAHVRQLPSGIWEEHFLDEHLREVANLAGKFAEHFDGEDWASLAGLWHDLGKYSSEFQHYIKTVSGYDAEAHIEGKAGRVPADEVMSRLRAKVLGAKNASDQPWRRSAGRC